MGTTSRHSVDLRGRARDAADEVVLQADGAEYDFLEYLYAKDQEGKVIQIMPYKSMGTERISFAQYSFVPPKGTSSITPFACFKIRGVWEGDRIPWDRDIDNPDMQWFTDMPLGERKALGDADKIDALSGNAHVRRRLRNSFLSCGRRIL